jgi:hypothetical protein
MKEVTAAAVAVKLTNERSNDRGRGQSENSKKEKAQLRLSGSIFEGRHFLCDGLSGRLSMYVSLH